MTSLECCYNKKQVEEFVCMLIVVSFAAFGSVEKSFQILNRFCSGLWHTSVRGQNKGLKSRLMNNNEYWGQPMCILFLCLGWYWDKSWSFIVWVPSFGEKKFKLHDIQLTARKFVCSSQKPKCCLGS